MALANGSVFIMQSPAAPEQEHFPRGLLPGCRSLLAGAGGPGGGVGAWGWGRDSALRGLEIAPRPSGTSAKSSVER